MTVLNLQVSASGDDSGTESEAGTAFAFSSTATSHFLGNRGGGQTAEVWSRFLNVTIPQGTTLTSAVHSIYNATTTFGEIKVKSKAADTDNHTAPTTGANSWSPAVTSGTDWTTLPSGAAANTWYSKDITTDIQTVINRAGFASGNAIGVRMIDNGSGANGRFFHTTYNSDTTKAAKLDITYTAGGGGFPDLLRGKLLTSQLLGGLAR